MSNPFPPGRRAPAAERRRPPWGSAFMGGAMLFAAMSAAIATAVAAAQAPQGTPSRAARERAAAEVALDRLASTSDEELQRQYGAARAERRPLYRAFDRDLMRAYRRALAQGGPQERRAVERALRAALGDLADRSPKELAARITEKGGIDDANYEMRDATLHLAMLARITGNQRYAAAAAALLARFAEVIPKWPIWNPYHASPAERQSMRQDDPKTFQLYDTSGLWGGWIHDDLLHAVPLLEANAMLESTGAVERTGAKDAIRRMFDLHLATQDKFDPNPGFSNQEVYRAQGYMEFGRLLPDPELVHEGVRRLRNIYHVGFFPDGWWKEGTIAYHTILQTDLRFTAENMLSGYSDPIGFKSRVDGRRFDDLDLEAAVRAPLERADMVTKRLVLPDGNLLAVHDTDWPMSAWNVAAPPERSHLFGSMGQGSLIAGRAGDDNYTRVTLHWGQDAGHAHRDSLNLNFWGKGTEVISETSYRAKPGSNSTREWQTSTAGHVTVVVDGVDQFPSGSLGSRQRKLGPDDDVPGVPNWRWRERWSFQDGGDLRIFSTRFPEVQVIEADATRAYDMVVGLKTYRRTVALVHIDPPGTPNGDFYVVDVFRVKGAPGSSHTFDWMLHSALQLDQELRLSAPVQPVSGTAHTMLRGLESGRVDGAWLSAFEMKNGVTLLTFIAPDPAGVETTVFRAKGPAMRRNGDAPFMFARRTGSEATFVAVHQALRGRTPRVTGIELIPTQCSDCVALRVMMKDRTDTVVSCADREKLCKVPGGGAGGEIEVRGLFAHVARGASPDQQWAMLIDGDLLRTPEARIEGETSHHGLVRGTLRVEAGDAFNGFVVDEAIPEGNTLAGCTMIVDQAGEMSWGYGVRAIGRHENDVVVVTPDEPGLIVEPGTPGKPGRVKQTYFPCWGFRGDARFRIPGDAMARPGPAGPRDATPTGAAKATWTGGASGAR